MYKLLPLITILLVLLLFAGIGCIVDSSKSPALATPTPPSTADNNSNSNRINYDEETVVKQRIIRHLRGLQGGGPAPRIINGEDAEIRRFPYFVALSNTDFDRVIFCGGSLIATDVVVTAAHCQGDDLQFALVGRYDTSSTLDPFELFRVEGQHPNPSFQDGQRSHDNMIVKLRGESKLPPVKVNLDDTMFRGDADDQKLAALGFGRVDASQPSSPDVLQFTANHRVSNSECVEAETGTVSYQNLVKDDMMCLNATESSICVGDSGGPILLLGNSVEDDLLVGTTAWGYMDCVSADLPAVAIRTSADDFIRSKTCEISSSPPDYFLCNQERTMTMSPEATPQTTLAPSLAPICRPASAVCEQNNDCCSNDCFLEKCWREKVEVREERQSLASQSGYGGSAANAAGLGL